MVRDNESLLSKMEEKKKSSRDWNGQTTKQGTKLDQRSVWWLLAMHYGLCGRQEHHDMTVEDFSFRMTVSNRRGGGGDCGYFWVGMCRWDF